MTESTPTPTDGASTTDVKAQRGPQNKIIEAYLSDSERFIATASTDPEIAPILANYGYDAAEFAIGTTLAHTAREAFEGRATGMGEATGATQEFNAAIKVARGEYAQFREIARASFPADSDRTALSLKGDVPDDTSRFITLATASYGAGKKAPHTTKLTKRGYPPAKFDTLIATLEALTAASADQGEAQGGAIGDTEARDQAYDALRAYMKELKGTARGALRSKNGLLAKLGL